MLGISTLKLSKLRLDQHRGASPPLIFNKGRPRKTNHPIKNVHVKLSAKYSYLALKAAVGFSQTPLAKLHVLVTGFVLI